MPVLVQVNGNIRQRARLGFRQYLGQALRRERSHLQRRGGLVGTQALILLARAEGLIDEELRTLVQSWGEGPWPSG